MSSSGTQALPDNSFDVSPGIPTVLDWPGTLAPPRILRVGNALMNPCSLFRRLDSVPFFRVHCCLLVGSERCCTARTGGLSRDAY